MEEKMEFSGKDIWKPIRFGTGVDIKVEKIFSWGDFLKVFVHPLFHFPNKPTDFSEIAGEYCKRTREVARELLQGISKKALGLEKNYIAKAMDLKSGLQLFVSNGSNLYPPCPQPELAMGIPAHTDHGLLIFLIENEIGGLQIRYNGKWFHVDPPPNSFLVNTGDHLQVLRNGKYKIIMHRAVVNNKATRISIAVPHGLSLDIAVSSAPELVESESRPAAYLPMKYKDYMDLQLDGKPYLDHIQLPFNSNLDLVCSPYLTSSTYRALMSSLHSKLMWGKISMVWDLTDPSSPHITGTIELAKSRAVIGISNSISPLGDVNNLTSQDSTSTYSTSTRMLSIHENYPLRDSLLHSTYDCRTFSRWHPLPINLCRLLPRPSASSPLDNKAHPMANTSQAPDLEGLHYEIHELILPPLNAPISQVLTKIKHEEFFKWPRKIKTDTRKRNRNKYCEFHRVNTEDYFQLKEQIADLVKKGYLRKYVTDHLPLDSPRRRYGNNRLTTGDIRVIHGRFRFGRCSSSSRKNHAISTHGLAEEEIYNLSSPFVDAHPPITFNNDDLKGLHLPNDDALVVLVVIAKFNV
ncbi:hypothetical protein Acr_00g0037940 [Actinidia rufa]|uniref:Fe2OG dioxygenase domain-containing protein n=1 Tax=Actinidia rufa TaxID=165716 RepID=A0A7J0DH13_9ERIC|nr:hypothetical protein Acr_00g0037940 [Actinidia rufa]